MVRFSRSKERPRGGSPRRWGLSAELHSLMPCYLVACGAFRHAVWFVSLSDWRFCASPTSLPKRLLEPFGTRRTSAPVFGTSLKAVPTFGLGFLAPADYCFDLSRSSGAGFAHSRLHLLLHWSPIVDMRLLEHLLWFSSLALHFSWFTLLGYFGSLQHERRRAASTSRTSLSVACMFVCFGVRIPGGTLPLAMCCVLQKHWPTHNTTQHVAVTCL